MARFYTLSLALVLALGCSDESTEREKTGGGKAQDSGLDNSPADSTDDGDDEGDQAEEPGEVSGSALYGQCEATLSPDDIAEIPEISGDALKNHDAVLGCSIKSETGEKISTVFEPTLKLTFDNGVVVDVEPDIAPTGSKWNAYYVIASGRLSGKVDWEFKAKSWIDGEPLVASGQIDLDQLIEQFNN